MTDIRNIKIYRINKINANVLMCLWVPESGSVYVKLHGEKKMSNTLHSIQ